LPSAASRKATLVRVGGDTDQLTPVLEGQAHAVLVPMFAPQVIACSAPDRLALPFAQPLSKATTAFGVRKGDARFRNFLDSWLAVAARRELDRRAQHVMARSSDQAPMSPARLSGRAIIALALNFVPFASICPAMERAR